ncbi:2,3-bisphosphoglycerate-independent phosphoglycerate mutase [Marixanthomonas sp. SCSIO 43207]|uniref:2,3-bisphosphoglycerate-independent phosphoglycerate mutase n=1 Tax=Marixanthomonas sp. SCSIO 43207 TaxID=2779360 RepID=UPI001CA7E77C|nr:2,3-bisphosphoglycerate-independent phosphoglycerate mutase [Marixanthomonas sp. SCSIO 43207]UAB81423.1 2,3-bisphosphoglycerate-independent phosphoglycerate mutase [Marixanthomonas sp. SCSIO 43207]
MNKKVLLLILDGWGVTQDPAVSAIAQANTPYIDSLYNKYPNAQLITHGMNVGLPDGQMGNSEVGHMNLGAGRIVYQDLAKINLAVKNNTLKDEPVLSEAFNYALQNNKKVHFIGLVSNGGVHSHINHLKGLLTAAHQKGLNDIFVHAFTDGRDVDPKSGAGHIEDLQNHLKTTNAKLASIIGRYFAMDRDKRWERVKKAYDLLVFGKGKKSTNALESIQQSYSENITDEFLEPIVLTENEKPIATIDKDDVVLFFNFRTDRGRQLTEALTQEDFPDYSMKKIPLKFVTMTNYDESFKNIEVIYNKENIQETLGEVLEKNKKTQIRIAETEKYPHVTFFFSGGREEPFEGEKRILCPSPKVATYDLQPEMSAYEIRDKIIPEINSKSADFICLNFANPDMVGHTGVFDAAVKACETVDNCSRGIIEAALANDYTTVVLADHGNSEKMRNEDGSPNTAHTINPVPVIIVDNNITHVKNGILGDIAPTILHLMGITKPESMTQDSLI